MSGHVWVPQPPLSAVNLWRTTDDDAVDSRCDGGAIITITLDVTMPRLRIATLYQSGDQFANSGSATQDRSQRTELKFQRDTTMRKLDEPLAVPRLTAEDMCADCATSVGKHGYVSPPFVGPCPAWPGFRVCMNELRRVLEAAAESVRARQATKTPKAGPLAVIPSGLPIAEVVQRLQELQQCYPTAQVRRGRANRWELWPADPV